MWGLVLRFVLAISPEKTTGRGSASSISREGLREFCSKSLRIFWVFERGRPASANVLVIGALVGILESSPTADIVDKNCTEIRLAILHIANQLFQRISTVNSKAAFAGIRVCPRDDHSSAFGILLDDFPLIIS